MTSNTNNPELFRPQQPVTHSSAPLVESWLSGDGFVTNEEPPRRLDRGLWLLGRKQTRESRWARLRDEYSESVEIDAIDRPSYDAVKRVLDVLVSILLLTSLAPLFAILALLIRLDSSGPAFFGQARVGHNGRTFLMWKFRSMHANSPAYARSPTSALDARVTRVGRFLRRTSMDELPQLLNVLRGEMSLVGPRPEMPFIAVQYSRCEHQRLVVKPGMTGLWQVSAARTAPIHHNLQWDFHYICNRNLLLDTAILIRTVVVVFSGNGPA